MNRVLHFIIFCLVTLLSAFLLDGAGQAQSLPDPNPVVNIPGGGTVAPEGNLAPPGTAAPTSAQASLDKGYQLGTGDKMKISVYGEDDLSGEFAVDGSGQVQFPLLGRVHAAGLTVSQFVDSLTAGLAAKYLRDPKVSVQIENYRPFYIMGEVNRPGEYPYENSLSALGAIALAGGYTYRANNSKIYIRRNGSSKEDSYPMSSTTPVYPGDVLRIAERIF